MKIDESSFETVAESTLRRWLERIDDANIDSIETEFDSGVLTLDVDGAGTFVITRHGPLRQLWLSSPVSGASHYDWSAERRAWLSTRGGQDLAEVLSRELSGATGAALDLD